MQQETVLKQQDKRILVIRGTCCIRVKRESTIEDPRNKGNFINVERNSWEIDHNIPIFSQNFEYKQIVVRNIKDSESKSKNNLIVVNAGNNNLH